MSTDISLCYEERIPNETEREFYKQLSWGRSGLLGDDIYWTSKLREYVDSISERHFKEGLYDETENVDNYNPDAETYKWNPRYIIVSDKELKKIRDNANLNDYSKKVIDGYLGINRDKYFVYFAII